MVEGLVRPALFQLSYPPSGYILHSYASGVKRFVVDCA
jgi:hypothetical protein